MTLKPIDFMEFLQHPGPESIGHFIANHDDAVRVCEHCKGHGVVGKFLFELSGSSPIPKPYLVEEQGGKP